MNFPATVMYNPKDRKIGSVHIQTVNNCTISTLHIVRHFSLDRIEKDKTKVSKFTILTKEEFNRIIKLTHSK